MNERIKKLRRALDLTQQEFADRVGIKRNTVANYETGRNEPIDTVLALICREFGVNEEWLRSGSGEMFTPSAPSELDALAKRYGLSHSDYILIEKFISMGASDRAVIRDFIIEVGAALASVDVAPDSPAVPDSVADAEELYRKTLSSAQSAGSSALNITDDIVPNKKEA